MLVNEATSKRQALRVFGIVNTGLAGNSAAFGFEFCMLDDEQEVLYTVVDIFCWSHDTLSFTSSRWERCYSSRNLTCSEKEDEEDGSTTI